MGVVNILTAQFMGQIPSFVYSNVRAIECIMYLRKIPFNGFTFSISMLVITILMVWWPWRTKERRGQRKKKSTSGEDTSRESKTSPASSSRTPTSPQVYEMPKVPCAPNSGVPERSLNFSGYCSFFPNRAESSALKDLYLKRYGGVESEVVPVDAVDPAETPRPSVPSASHSYARPQQGSSSFPGSQPSTNSGSYSHYNSSVRANSMSTGLHGLGTTHRSENMRSAESRYREGDGPGMKRHMSPSARMFDHAPYGDATMGHGMHGVRRRVPYSGHEEHMPMQLGERPVHGNASMTSAMSHPAWRPRSPHASVEGIARPAVNESLTRRGLDSSNRSAPSAVIGVLPVSHVINIPMAASEHRSVSSRRQSSSAAARQTAPSAPPMREFAAEPSAPPLSLLPAEEDVDSRRSSSEPNQTEVTAAATTAPSSSPAEHSGSSDSGEDSQSETSTGTADPSDGSETEHDSEESNRCSVCLEHKCNYVLVPCGHMCLCESCQTKFPIVTSQCPLCRKRITSKVRVYT